MIDYKSCAELISLGCKHYADNQIVFIRDEQENTLKLPALYERSLNVARALKQLDIKEGDVVAIQSPNWQEGLEMFYGAWLTGAVVLPIIHIYGEKEVRYILEQSKAKVFASPSNWKSRNFLDQAESYCSLKSLEHLILLNDEQPGFIGWDELEQLGRNSDKTIPETVQPHEDTNALLIFTSGTTADPKGVLHTHRSLLAELKNNIAHYRGEHPVALSPFPIGHLAGVICMLQPLLFGSDLILMDAWQPEIAARLIENHKVSYATGTPYFINTLFEAADTKGYDLSSLKTYKLGATSIPPELVGRCEQRGITTYRGYGSSEHPSISAGAPSDSFEKRMNTDGKLQPGVRVRIVDDNYQDLGPGQDGEILSTGPDLFAGYLQNEYNQKAFLDGWFITGDIGRLDDEGYLSITDRKKDIIIRGGENISSKEVEDALLLHSAISEAGVIGFADKNYGERVCAVIIVNDQYPEPQLTEIQKHFENLGIAKQKTPEKIVTLETLPRNAAGKINKVALRHAVNSE